MVNKGLRTTGLATAGEGGEGKPSDEEEEEQEARRSRGGHGPISGNLRTQKTLCARRSDLNIARLASKIITLSYLPVVPSCRSPRATRDRLLSRGRSFEFWVIVELRASLLTVFAGK